MTRAALSARESRLISGPDSVGVKVLLIGTGASPIPPPGYGAVERIIFEYGQALARAGQSVKILNEVHGKGSLAEYRFALHLPSLLRREQYDVVHASTPVVASRLAAGGVPFVYTSHSRHWFWRENWRHRWGYWLERRAVRRASAVVALTSELEGAMRAALSPVLPRHIRVIPYGVDANAYAPDWGRRTGRNALGVGVIVPLKRWEIAAAALKGTGIRLRIVGPISNPSYAARVRGAGDAVELLGQVDEARLRELYSESDLLVHPSQVEVLPRAVLEAMASDLPVVGSSVVRSVFPEGRGAFIAPANSSEDALVQYIRTSAVRLAEDSNLRHAMGESGRAVAKETYSWDHIVAAHLDLYREVTGLGA